MSTFSSTRSRPCIDLPRLRRGFTLIEMLLVVAILSLLIAVLLPTLTQAREQVNRSLCATRLHQLATASVSYSNDHQRRLPTGIRGDGAEHLPWISADLFDILQKYSSVAKPSSQYVMGAAMSDAMLECPNFAAAGPGYYNPSAKGWVLGYLYLGGHPKVAATPLSAGSVAWRSPILTKDGSLALWVDWNEWSPRDRWTIVPHTENGARRDGGSYYNGSSGGARSSVMGAQGGNVAKVDCSIGWKPLSQMHQRETSLSIGNWLGMW